MNETSAAGASTGLELDPSTRLWETPLKDEPGFLLARVNALSLAYMNNALRDVDLRPRAYSLLAIAAADTRPTQRELSEFLQLDPSQIVALIDSLEKRGLVRREPDENDRRAKVLVATEEGKKLAEQAHETVARSNDEWFARIPADARAQLSATLFTLATE